MLITPHGDRKHGERPQVLESRLPCTRSHYPSWGSKTLIQPAIAPCGLRVTSSLPLMGIENPARITSALRNDAVLLITPHGDRKPLRTVSTDCPEGPTVSSLPLMGIENAAVYDRTGSKACSPSTHYPSWGSKTLSKRTLRPVVHDLNSSLPLMGIENLPVAAQSLRRVCPSASLPLMGIENFRFRGLARVRGGAHRLITPHGDRKLATSGRHHPARPPAASHYPSWGSKTRDRRC